MTHKEHGSLWLKNRTILAAYSYIAGSFALLRLVLLAQSPYKYPQFNGDNIMVNMYLLLWLLSLKCLSMFYLDGETCRPIDKEEVETNIREEGNSAGEGTVDRNWT